MDPENQDPKSKGSNSKGKPSVEEIYVKQSQHQHILSRPDTYIGSIEASTENVWVIDSSSAEPRFTNRKLTFVPGLYKIFDEILVNASDNKQRDPDMSEIRVEIDQASNTISVMNDGKGIPVVYHQKEKMYVPQLIFGHLLTSSNYNDNEARTAGGRNGYGAKLTNIFSKSFTVETLDTESKQLYKQCFSNNMLTMNDPEIRAVPASAKAKSYTKVTFTPDLARFGMTCLDDDIVALFTKRVYDIAGTCPGLKVFLNNERLKIKDFKAYADLYLSADTQRIYCKPHDRWEVIVGISSGEFQQVSFVNGINTLNGGTHVAYISDQVTKGVLEILTNSKKHKKEASGLKDKQVKNHLWVFVNSLIVNPSFDTQTKVNLTTKKSGFGSDPKLGEDYIKKICTPALIERILSQFLTKQDKTMKKNDGKKSSRVLGIAKLEDANQAGGRLSQNCTLVLTEGDSAKALAMSGLSVVGRDLFGVFPLRGKVLNVREATPTQISENAEITAIKQILGLQQGKVYNDTSALRYGHVMIMTDQDHDGSHIKGLLINMFATFWPSLLKLPGFLTEFITPIVKVSKGNKETPFYTIPEYESWKEGHNEGKGWKIKYYKGLGTSTSAEAKVYFANIDSHQIPFSYNGDNCMKMIELAFKRSMADARKDWLGNFQPGTYLDHCVSKINYEEFINREFILFAMASNQRAIPSLVDGLKPGQRKVLFSSFKRKLTKEIKVAQLAGYVSENSAYHHGEVSLAATIINMAQNYVGSNNVNYLWPSGQFGTRADGGKDAASPRYVFTYLSPVTRMLFQQDDDNLLNYLNDDGQSIEPEYYVPVIPTVLMNGSSGIGTGWSTSIPNYNPRDIIANIRRMLNKQTTQNMHPWYKGFIGELTAKGTSGSYVSRGLVERVDDCTVHIYELPIGKWTGEYKAYLETLIPGTVTSYQEYHTDVNVSFGVTLTPEAMSAAEVMGFEKYFKLEAPLTTGNMVLFNSQGLLKRYSSPQEILMDYYPIRFNFYVKRKVYLVNVLSQQLEKLDNKARFILAVINDTLKIRGVKKTVILEQLRKQGFKAITKDVDANANSIEGDGNDNDEDEDSKEGGINGYNYLLSMPLWSLTHEKVQELTNEKATKQSALVELQSTSEEAMWSRDLDALEVALDAHDKKEEKELNAAENAKYGAGHRLNQKKRSANDSDDDVDSESEDDYAPKKKKAQAKKPAAKTAAGKANNRPAWVNVKRPKEQTIVIESTPVKRGKKALVAEAEMNSIAEMLMSDDPFAISTATATATETAKEKKPRAPRVPKDKTATTTASKNSGKGSAAVSGKGKKADKYDSEGEFDESSDDDDVDNSYFGFDDDDNEDDFEIISQPKNRKAIAVSSSSPSSAAPAKAPARATKKKSLDDDDEFDSLVASINFDDNSDTKAKAKAPAQPKAKAAPAAPKRKPVSKILDDDDDDNDGVVTADESEDDYAPKKKAAPKPKPTTTATTAAKKGGKAVKEPSTPPPKTKTTNNNTTEAAPFNMEQARMSLSLAERLALMQASSNPSTVSSSFDDMFNSNSQSDSLSQSQSSSTAAANKRKEKAKAVLVPGSPMSPPHKKTKAKRNIIDDDDDEDGDEFIPKSRAKAPVAAKAKPAANSNAKAKAAPAAKPKGKKSKLESDDEASNDDSEFDYAKASVSSKTVSRPSRSSKPTTSFVEDESDYEDSD